MKSVFKYKGGLRAFLKRYDYQPQLTKALDALTEDFNQEIVNQIVLWKVNRYAALNPGTVKALNGLVKLKPRQHRRGATCLKALLEERGVGLPMASTLLRFRNPQVFQIIDRHAYRALYGETLPNLGLGMVKERTDLYFDYLDALRSLGLSRQVPFRALDRILYIFDIEQNGELD